MFEKTQQLTKTNRTLCLRNRTQATLTFGIVLRNCLRSYFKDQSQNNNIKFMSMQFKIIVKLSAIKKYQIFNRPTQSTYTDCNCVQFPSSGGIAPYKLLS